MAFGLDCHVLLRKVILLLSQRKIVASWIKCFNIDVVEPDEVLQVVHQADFGGDRLSLGEMVHQLMVLQRVVIDIL